MAAIANIIRTVAAALRPAPRVAYVVVAEGNIRHGDGSWRPAAPEVVSPAYATEAEARAVLAAYGRRALGLNERVAVRAVAI